MNIINSNISCDVCLDLIPLVRDKVASEDSSVLVYEHIKGCDNCKSVFENTYIVTDNTIDDKKIINSIRHSLVLSGLTFIICGALIGVYLSNSFGMFYNFLIMPIVGGLSHLILNKKWYLTTIGIFFTSYTWLFIQSIYEGAMANGLNIEIFTIPIFLSTIYCSLTMLGVIIATLLKFAFKKEVENEKE